MNLLLGLANGKVVARATKPGNDGAQLLIYDLVGAGGTVVPNPPGVTLYGQAAAPATAPQILIANPKANTVAAIGMDQNARRPGLVVVGSSTNPMTVLGVLTE